jgi:lysophospholipid acyltransferase
LIFLFLLSYPLAGILKRIPDSQPWKKNVFIIGYAAHFPYFEQRTNICASASLFYLVGVFDLWSGLRTIFLSAVAAYLISAFVQGPLMPWIGFVVLMGHMSVNHIYRQMANTPGSVDVTGKNLL